MEYWTLSVHYLWGSLLAWPNPSPAFWRCSTSFRPAAPAPCTSFLTGWVSTRGRYGAYRLAPGYRMPPLILTDDEAVAVLLGLIGPRRATLQPDTAVAVES